MTSAVRIQLFHANPVEKIIVIENLEELDGFAGRGVPESDRGGMYKPARGFRHEG